MLRLSAVGYGLSRGTTAAEGMAPPGEKRWELR